MGPGYTRTEKRSIAEQFLIPKQLKEHGLTTDQVTWERESIELLIDSYTREAGVRNLEREVAAIYRDVTVKLAEGKTVKGKSITTELVRELLGPERFKPELAERKLVPGVAVGLGVSSAGGDLLIVEATQMPGKGEIVITGSLRAVMKEAGETAVSLVRSRAALLGLDPQWLRSIDLHVHAPRGGASRDAASFGLPVFVAVASLLLRAPCKSASRSPERSRCVVGGAGRHGSEGSGARRASRRRASGRDPGAQPGGSRGGADRGAQRHHRAFREPHRPGAAARAGRARAAAGRRRPGPGRPPRERSPVATRRGAAGMRTTRLEQSFR